MSKRLLPKQPKIDIATLLFAYKSEHREKIKMKEPNISATPWRILRDNHYSLTIVDARDNVLGSTTFRVNAEMLRAAPDLASALNNALPYITDPSAKLRARAALLAAGYT